MYRSVIATLGLILAPSLAVADDAPTGDLAKLQGTWTAKSGPEKDIPVTLTIKKSTIEVVIARNGQEVRAKGEIKLDETANPRTVDWVNLTGPNGVKLPDSLAIYKLDGDSWTVCGGGHGEARPTEFKAGDDGPPILTVLTRVKADDKPIAGDLGKLQGVWTAKHGEDATVTMTIKENAVTATWPRGDGTNLTLRGEVRVNENAKPKTLDFFHFKGDGEELGDTLGIYTLDGETLKVCTGAPGEERPTEFKGGEGGPPNLLVFSRKKD